MKSNYYLNQSFKNFFRFFKNFDTLNKKISTIKNQFGNNIGREREKKENL